MNSQTRMKPLAATFLLLLLLFTSGPNANTVAAQNGATDPENVIMGIVDSLNVGFSPNRVASRGREDHARACKKLLYSARR